MGVEQLIVATLLCPLHPRSPIATDLSQMFIFSWPSTSIPASPLVPCSLPPPAPPNVHGRVTQGHLTLANLHCGTTIHQPIHMLSNGPLPSHWMAAASGAREAGDRAKGLHAEPPTGLRVSGIMQSAPVGGAICMRFELLIRERGGGKLGRRKGEREKYKESWAALAASVAAEGRKRHGGTSTEILPLSAAGTDSAPVNG